MSTGAADSSPYLLSGNAAGRALRRGHVRREEQGGLRSRKDDLEARVVAQRDMEAQVAAVPVKVQTFLEDFQGMDLSRAKGILQGIIKAAHVFSDGRIELGFRG